MPRSRASTLPFDGVPPVALRRLTEPVLVVLLPLVLLGVGRLLPPEGAGLALRLTGAAALVLLVPGRLVLGVIGRPRQPGLEVASSFVWSLALCAAALVVTFADHGSIETALLVVAAVSAVLLVVPRRHSRRIEPAATFPLAAVAAAGLGVAAVVWWSTGTIGGSVGPTAGDALFHLARVRKLVELPSLSLRALDEFRDGGLHPGYAFPLWHGAEAMIIRLAGVDAAPAFLHLPAILAPLVLVVAFAAGHVVFGSWAGGIATAAAELAVVVTSGGGVGALQFLAQPAAVARLLIVPALLALLFAYATDGSRAYLATAAAGGLVLALVHPTYLTYTMLLGGSFAGARALLARGRRRREAARVLVALGAVVVAALAVLAWLAPLVRQTAAFSPSAAETRRALGRYSPELVIGSSTYALRPGFLAWGGAATVAALLAVPLAALATRRAWSAYVVGATAALGALALLPPLFTRFADTVSLSQALRVGGFLPLSVALAGAAELAGAAGAAAPVLGLTAGCVAVLAVPGPTLGAGWAALAAVAASGLVLGLAALRVLPDPRVPVRDRWTAAAAVAFLVPALASGLAHLRRFDAPDPYGLTPGLVQALSADVAPRDVVFSNVETSYRITGALPVYVAASLPGHVARTPANRPYERQWDTVRFFFRPSVTDAERWAILGRYDARWVVVDERQRFPPFIRLLRPVYADGRYRLYRVPALPVRTLLRRAGRSRGRG